MTDAKMAEVREAANFLSVHRISNYISDHGCDHEILRKFGRYAKLLSDYALEQLAGVTLEEVEEALADQCDGLSRVNGIIRVAVSDLVINTKGDLARIVAALGIADAGTK